MGELLVKITDTKLCKSSSLRELEGCDPFRCQRIKCVHGEGT